MSNMSYCRFRNTLGDLQECVDAIRNREHLSDEEALACRRMVREMYDLLNTECFIDGEGEYDQGEVDEAINDMKENDY